ncbi:bifunctional DNA primase/polymerase [Streptomyces lavendulae]|uniref:bifunctional DNA primase/polymerase n=1 Tax=Streptomyces lavendulae TaxID=1914 RepID=UPI003817D493
MGRHPERSVDGLRLARWCASNGWPVHPLAPGRKTPAANCRDCGVPGHTHTDCPCQAAGRWCHGFHAATLDYNRIQAWWGAQPGLGVGVRFPRDAGSGDRGSDGSHERSPDDACTAKISAGVA